MLVLVGVLEGLETTADGNGRPVVRSVGRDEGVTDLEEAAEGVGSNEDDGEESRCETAGVGVSG